jgi:hypothetical protein
VYTTTGKDVFTKLFVFSAILTVFLIWAFAFGLFKLSCIAYKKYKAHRNVAETEHQPETVQHPDDSKDQSEQETKPVKKRLKSLDTFRG